MDVNGDGFADLIVGIPTPRSFNNLETDGDALVFSGSDGSLLFNLSANFIFDEYGFFVGDEFGSSVSGVGDVNGDGVDDYIVGAPNGGANNGGYVRLFVSQVTVPFILSDADRNGVVDFSDIAAFVAVLQFGIFLEQADVNQDGELNFADIPAFIEILQAI